MVCKQAFVVLSLVTGGSFEHREVKQTTISLPTLTRTSYTSMRPVLCSMPSPVPAECRIHGDGEGQYSILCEGAATSVGDLGLMVIGTSSMGTPIALADVATIAIGPSVRHRRMGTGRW